MPRHPQVEVYLDGNAFTVDAGMFSLLSAVWAAGIKTIFSCQGEWYEQASPSCPCCKFSNIYEMPYMVYEFGRSEDLVKVLEENGARRISLEGDMAQLGVWSPGIWEACRWVWEADDKPGITPYIYRCRNYPDWTPEASTCLYEIAGENA